MTNRAFLIFGGLLILVIAVQVGVLIQQRQALRAASLEIRATSAGIPLAPDDAQVFVYQDDTLAARGKAAERLALPPGRYHVRVLHARARDQLAILLHDVALDVGQDRVEQVDFPVGELSVEATVGTRGVEQGDVVVTVFRPEDHDRIITSMKAGEAILLGAGRYDLRVVGNLDTEEKAVSWLREVEVQAGLRTVSRVAFDRGILLVRARNGAADLPSEAVELTVYRAGDLDRNIVERGRAGVPLGLAAAAYDVEARFVGSNDRPSRWLEGIEIASGETLEKTVAFSSGTALVTALLKDAGPLDGYQVYVYYYRAGDHAQPVTYAPAGEPVVLASGGYDIRAHFYRSHDKPDIWLRGVALPPGETVAEVVTFPSARLLLRAYDPAGAEQVGDTVFVHVYARGERVHPLITARSGEILVLTEGAYDIRLQDSRAPACELWLTDFRLGAGPLQVRSVTLPTEDTKACAVAQPRSRSD